MPASLEQDLFSLLPPGRLEFMPRDPMSEDEFFELSERMHPLRLERDPDGTITIKPPVGSYSSTRSNEISSQLRNWATETSYGAAFDSSGGFRLPNGATRAPDAAWVAEHRLEVLSKKTKEGLLPLAPDFVVEVLSKNDPRSTLEGKMEEYLENGTRLGWLIDPYEETVTVYRQDGSEEVRDKPETLSGDSVLPEFECNLVRVWTPDY